MTFEIKESRKESVWAPGNYFAETNPEKIDKIILYHGTTDRLLERICRDGLLPRDMSGIEATDAGYDDNPLSPSPSLEGRVYLGVKSIARGFGSERAVDKWGGTRVVIGVEVDTKNLVPDEDSKKETWYESLEVCGCCAHRGKIRKENFVSIEMVGEFQLPRQLEIDLHVRRIKKEISKEDYEKEYKKLKDEYSKPLEILKGD